MLTRESPPRRQGRAVSYRSGRVAGSSLESEMSTKGRVEDLKLGSVVSEKRKSQSKVKEGASSLSCANDPPMQKLTHESAAVGGTTDSILEETDPKRSHASGTDTIKDRISDVICGKDSDATPKPSESENVSNVKIQDADPPNSFHDSEIAGEVASGGPTSVGARARRTENDDIGGKSVARQTRKKPQTRASKSGERGAKGAASRNSTGLTKAKGERTNRFRETKIGNRRISSVKKLDNPKARGRGNQDIMRDTKPRGAKPIVGEAKGSGMRESAASKRGTEPIDRSNRFSERRVRDRRNSSKRQSNMTKSQTSTARDLVSKRSAASSLPRQESISAPVVDDLDASNKAAPKSLVDNKVPLATMRDRNNAQSVVKKRESLSKRSAIAAASAARRDSIVARLSQEVDAARSKRVPKSLVGRKSSRKLLAGKKSALSTESRKNGVAQTTQGESVTKKRDSQSKESVVAPMCASQDVSDVVRPKRVPKSLVSHGSSKGLPRSRSEMETPEIQKKDHLPKRGPHVFERLSKTRKIRMDYSPKEKHTHIGSTGTVPVAKKHPFLRRGSSSKIPLRRA